MMSRFDFSKSKNNQIVCRFDDKIFAGLIKISDQKSTSLPSVVAALVLVGLEEYEKEQDAETSNRP